MILQNQDLTLKHASLAIGNLVQDGIGYNQKDKDAIGLLNGTSGIILFLVELYRQTGKTTYLTTVEVELEKLVRHCTKEQTLDYSYLTGRMSVVHALLRVYTLTKNEIYLHEAISISKKCADEYMNAGYTSNCYASGRAGSLITLLHLHNLTQEKWILTLINIFIKRILDQAQQAGHGLYWRDLTGNIGGEYGFLYGTSGIGYTFLELGHYFQNDALYSVAEKSFAHEDFHSDKNSWPSRQHLIRDAETYQLHLKNYKSGNIKFFQGPTGETSYAYGQAGTGLARLRAHELLKNEVYKDTIAISFQSIKENVASAPNNSIYDGKAGYGMFALELFRSTNNVDYLNFAKGIANDLLSAEVHSSAGNSVEHGLYNGLSGLGYFYLQLQDLHNIPSVVLPSVRSTIHTTTDVSSYPYLTISRTAIDKLCLKKHFPRTLCILETVALRQLKKFLETLPQNNNIVEEFKIFTKNVQAGLDNNYLSAIQSISTLEFEKFKIQHSLEREGLIHMTEVDRLEQVERLFAKNEDLFLNTNIQFSKNATICHSTFNPKVDVDFELLENDFVSTKEYTVLLWPTNHFTLHNELRMTSKEFFPKFNMNNVLEKTLNDFELLVLKDLTKPKTIKNIIDEASHDAYFQTVTEDRVTSRKKIYHLLKDHLISGMLTHIQN